jgi:hypothetical protein
MSSSNGWQTAHRAEAEEALLAADSKVKARFNPAQQDLPWLNVKLAHGGWTYLVIDRRTGDLKAQTFDVVKKRCWEKARDALATQERARRGDGPGLRGLSLSTWPEPPWPARGDEYAHTGPVPGRYGRGR